MNTVVNGSAVHKRLNITYLNTQESIALGVKSAIKGST